MELNPYEKFLAGQEPIPVLTTTAGRLYELTAPLSGAQIDRVPAPGKWSIREIIAHLADCELVFSFRFRQTLSRDHALIQPFNQQAWAERYAAYDLDSALSLFKSARNWNTRLLTTVSEEDRHRPTTHPERGTMTFWTLVETMAGHDIDHLQQIERLATI
ncbi:MAG: DinB family protein [Edaphobacter sp.]